MLDPLLLRTFVAITEAKSFSEAGRQLGLSQSSVSEHVKQLEQLAGRQLLQRDTHSHALTEDGQAMLEFARSIWRPTPAPRGISRNRSRDGAFGFGASEDLAIGWLGEASKTSCRRIPRWTSTSPSP